MAMLAHNPNQMKIKPIELSQDQAKEYINANQGEESYENLPDEAKPKKRKFKTLG